MGQGCVKTLDTSKLGGTNTSAEAPVVAPGAFYQDDLFVHPWIRESGHSRAALDNEFAGHRRVVKWLH
jgi:hypothetical protein